MQPSMGGTTMQGKDSPSVSQAASVCSIPLVYSGEEGVVYESLSKALKEACTARG